MGYIALVRCVLVLRCGLAGLVWYPDAGWSLHCHLFFISLFNVQHVSDVNTSILRGLRLICWVISWVILLWYDVCWCYVVVWLGWCGIRMQAEACIVTCFLFHYLMLNMFRMLIHPSSGTLRLICWVISWVVLLWYDVCWCYVVVCLGSQSSWGWMY